MAPDEKQPKFALKRDVARMAQVQKLFKHDRLDPIDRYASHFHLDPDKVFTDTSFDTVFAFLIKWKDESEFNERFSYIYSEIQSATTSKK
jgi:hypothetical protein